MCYLPSPRSSSFKLWQHEVLGHMAAGTAATGKNVKGGSVELENQCKKESKSFGQLVVGLLQERGL